MIGSGKHVRKKRHPVLTHHKQSGVGACRFCKEYEFHLLTCQSNKREGKPMNDLQRAASKHNWRKMMLKGAIANLHLVSCGLGFKLPSIIEQELAWLLQANDNMYNAEKFVILSRRNYEQRTAK